MLQSRSRNSTTVSDNGSSMRSSFSKIIPRPPVSTRLVYSPLYRMRVGDYRVIYRVEDEQCLILVIELGHRRDIYR